MNQPQSNSGSLDHSLKLTREEFVLIGKELVISNLPIARQIIQKAISRKRGKWDLNGMPAYHTPGMDRRLFIGVVLFIYNEEFILRKEKINPRTGFVTKISQILAMPQSNVSILVREVVVALQVYDEFRLQVENHIQSFNNPNNENN